MCVVRVRFLSGSVVSIVASDFTGMIDGMFLLLASQYISRLNIARLLALCQ
jgi:hypothetical protein